MDVIDLRKLVEYSQDKIYWILWRSADASKELLKTRNYNLMLVCLDFGQNSIQIKTYDVRFYVIEGSGTFTMDKEKADLSSAKWSSPDKCGPGYKKRRAHGCAWHTRTSLEGAWETCSKTLRGFRAAQSPYGL